MREYATLLTFAALLGGCPLDVELETGEVCLSRRDVPVEGVAATQVMGSFEAGGLDQIHELLELDAELALVRARLQPTSGPADLTFLDHATITLASGDPDAALPTLVAYTCDDCAGDVALELPASVQHDIADYLRADQVVIGVELAGELPAEAWTMDVDVCLRGVVR